MIPNDYTLFLRSLNQNEPNLDWPEALRAMWYNASENWEASHNIAQDLHTDIGSWIHAYLHRKEGDDWNAGYWHQKIGKSLPKKSLALEAEELVGDIIASNRG